MTYRSLQDAIDDLDNSGQLLRIDTEVDPNLEMAEIHRRVFDEGGPAILFEQVKGNPFRAVSNLYGTKERTDYLFRKTLPKIKKLIKIKADPIQALKNPFKFASVPFTGLEALPMKSLGKAPVEYAETTIDQLPQIVSWPQDGGAFITLPQVFTLPPGSKNAMDSNIGMYRIQLSGNDYELNKEIGLHYQLHRGIGIHHKAYLESDEPFRASIFVGGPPAHTFCAIMPMPEGISELTFAGMLNGRRFRYKYDDAGYFLSAEADFVITGTIDKQLLKPEGPFGDHLGYYSLEHPFPVMKVDKVYHRKDALWHFTVVGRPPAEDTYFGYLIHKLVEDLTPGEFPGLKSINAVDAAGVHPLLLAIGQERYMPFREKRPEEIITIANRLLGSGQTSLAKYLIIAAEEDNPNLDTEEIADFFDHVLERIDWKRDLHFHTKTTIDTLDYSGSGWNEGSKVIMACRGDKKRDLGTSLPEDLDLPKSCHDVRVIRPGVLGLSVYEFSDYDLATEEIGLLSSFLPENLIDTFPLVLILDDAAFTAETLNNFLWVTFTRSNPSHDIYGQNSFQEHKHWGCNGSLIIDARIKPHHAPPLVPDTEVSKQVDNLKALKKLENVKK